MAVSIWLLDHLACNWLSCERRSYGIPATVVLCQRATVWLHLKYNVLQHPWTSVAPCMIAPFHKSTKNVVRAPVSIQLQYYVVVSVMIVMLILKTEHSVSFPPCQVK